MSKTNPVVQKLLDASESFADLEATSPGCDATAERAIWPKLREMDKRLVETQAKASALAKTVHPVIMQLERDLAEARRAAEALAGELRLAQIALEVVYSSDRKNLAAKCCVERTRKVLAQWEEAKK